MTTQRKRALENAVVTYGYTARPLEAIQDFILNDKPFEGEARDWLAFTLAARSNAEVDWQAMGRHVIQDAYQFPVVFEGYEWESYKIPGGSYTPDFLYILSNGQRVCVEVKGSKLQASYRDARARLRVAASLNPWIIFIEADKTRDGWKIETIKADSGLIVSMLNIFKE